MRLENGSLKSWQVLPLYKSFLPDVLLHRNLKNLPKKSVSFSTVKIKELIKSFIPLITKLHPLARYKYFTFGTGPGSQLTVMNWKN